jgi:hypothetical protein
VASGSNYTSTTLFSSSSRNGFRSRIPNWSSGERQVNPEWTLGKPKSEPDPLPDAAANRPRKGVSKRTEIDILGCARGGISTDGAADDLYDQIDE